MTSFRTFTLTLLCACSGGDALMVDGDVPIDAGMTLDAEVADGGVPLDAEVADGGVPLDAEVADGGVPLDAGMTLDSGASGMDAGPTCVRGMAHRDRCVFLVRSNLGWDVCPTGARRARWANRAEQRELQAVLVALPEASSAATSLRRVNGVGPWTWDDRSEAPTDLLWATPPGSVLPNAYLTESGLVPLHTEASWTLCESE